jgi:hypothetical protein
MRIIQKEINSGTVISAPPIRLGAKSDSLGHPRTDILLSASFSVFIHLSRDFLVEKPSQHLLHRDNRSREPTTLPAFFSLPI